MCTAGDQNVHRRRPTALPIRLRVRLATLALALFANAFAMSNPFPCAQLPVKPAAWSAWRLG